MAGSGVKAIQALLEGIVKGGGFDRHLSRVKVLAGGNGFLTAVMKVEQDDSNRVGFLHGGMSALLVDDLSSIALMTHPKNKGPGLSIAMNMEYMKAVKVGEEVLIKVSTDKVGNRLAFMTVDILDRKSGDLIVKGSHTKYMG